MRGIKRDPDFLKGSTDGVMALVQCNVAQFDRQAEKGRGRKRERVLKAQSNMPCRIKASYSEGTVGFSIREIDLLITVRLDELMEVLKEAAEFHQSFRDSLPVTFKDAELEKRWEEFTEIELVEADSPSGLILKEDWWIFTKGTDKDDILTHFDNNHSKGLSFLQKE